MQYDNQQNSDPSGQNNPLDPFRQAAGDQADSAIDNLRKRVPGGQQYADQGRQAAGQGLDSMQQQGQQGTVPGQGTQQDQGTQQANASSNDPNNPYGKADDFITGQRDQGQQDQQQGQINL
jgi:hypothetical protein